MRAGAWDYESIFLIVFYDGLISSQDSCLKLYLCFYSRQGLLLSIVISTGATDLSHPTSGFRSFVCLFFSRHGLAV